VNADVIRAMVQPISEEQAKWKPAAESWSLHEVMDHFYREERGDFRAHLQEMFSDPPQPWGALQPAGSRSFANCHQILGGFLQEREASVVWLRSLEVPNWEVAIQASFGPEQEILTLKAGDVLISWVAHDFLHIRQLNEILYAWNMHQGTPFSVDYAGGW
jgi:hypothetical protein